MFRQSRQAVEPGETLRVRGKMKLTASATETDTYALQILDPFVDPIVDPGNTALAEDNPAVTDGSNTDWQDVSVEWTNSGDVPRDVLIRAVIIEAAYSQMSEVFEVVSGRQSAPVALIGSPMTGAF